MTQTPKNQREVEKLKEKLAAIEHERWADWQKYFFTKCDSECEGEKCFLTLPSTLLMRWQRQIDTPYAELSREDQEKDLREVARYWPLIEALLLSREKEIVERIISEIEKTFGQDGAEIELIKKWQDFPKTEMETEWAKGGIRFSKGVVLNILFDILTEIKKIKEV